MTAIDALRQERATLTRANRALLVDLAHAIVKELPTLEDLSETVHANYDRLQALEILIASYDPQGGLFPDWKETP